MTLTSSQATHGSVQACMERSLSVFWSKRNGNTPHIAQGCHSPICIAGLVIGARVISKPTLTLESLK
ncbi:unnamed protein product [Haemonchus placei]|uniref:Uncharacterized protein n=1 Tax=Haemonchus placei TaxID=6290 RepID=A0A0N4VTQ2_HAEPC|nr:unnamed protein product [Haemonchus placei]